MILQHHPGESADLTEPPEANLNLTTEPLPPPPVHMESQEILYFTSAEENGEEETADMKQVDKAYSPQQIEVHSLMGLPSGKRFRPKHDIDY